VEEEEDLDSSYILSGRMEPSLSFTTTATSHARLGSQLTPVQALAMALELLRYQPTEGGCEGWLIRITKLIALSNEDLALGVTQGAGAPDLAAGPRASGAGNSKSAAANRVASCAASSPRGEPSCQIV
jgi:hypothetical protein